MLNTILGILGWVGTALVFAGVAIRLFRPEWDQYAYWAAVGGLVLVSLYTLSQWREIVRSFQKRETRFGAMTSISVIAVLGILVGLNYLVSRRDKRWDLTATQSFTLSDQTVKVLNDLKTPVKVLVFDRPADFSRFRDALASYEYVSPNVQVEYVDADRQPARVKDYGVLNYGTVVLEHDGRRENVMSEREQDLTNALIKVTSGRETKAYFVTGHGEKNSAGSDRNGYSNVLDSLKRDNYTIDTIVLAQSAAGVPADASVLIIAGPTADYLQPEVDAIKAYLRKGGKALVLLDPPVAESVRPVPTLESLLKEWGISMGHDVVIDISGMGQLLGTDASVPVATTYPSHPVTENFTLLTAFPLAQSVNGQADALGSSASIQNLIQTSDRSWSESDVKSLTSGGKVSMEDAAGDRKGPITVALSLSMDAPDAPAPPAPAAGEEAPAKPQARIIVVGDSDFASNAASGIQGNADLFVNMNNWLTQQENLISIRPRDAGDRRVTMTADQQRRVGWLSLLIIPGLILGSGVYTWWQRR
jgi:ABC-type uncharacterized transport system involved in gliding motility auxiliary subunit